MFFFFFPDALILADPQWTMVRKQLAFARKAAPHLSVGALETLMHIASNQMKILHEGLSLKEISDQLGTNYSTCARQTDMLKQWYFRSERPSSDRKGQ